MTEASFELGFLDSPAGPLPFVRRGAGSPATLLIIQPLFEERNRLRRLLAAVARRLADAGIESWTLDLPGTGDSPLPTAEADWSIWRVAIQTAVQSLSINQKDKLHILSVRGGCLLDDLPARSLYRFAPVAGERLLRELMRTRAAANDGVTVGRLEADTASGKTIELAGYALPAPLVAALRDATPAHTQTPLRTAVVDEGAADIRLVGPPLWRQAEPAEEPALAKALADDLATWIATCRGR